MSFLHEVLAVAEKVELEQINTKASELSIAVNSCKEEVVQFLENVYVKFLDRPKHNRELTRKLTKIHEEMAQLKGQMEQVRVTDLRGARDAFETHQDDLNTTIDSIAVVRVFYNVHEALRELSNLQIENDYVESIEKIKETEEYLNSIATDQTAPLLNQLCTNLDVEKHVILNKLSNEFRDSLIFEETDSRSVLKVKTNRNLQSVLKALYSYKNYVSQLDEVTKFLWNCVFVPIVDSVVEIRVEDEEFASLEVVKTDSRPDSMRYLQVFDAIKKVLGFLSENLRFELSSDLNSLEYIGRDIRDNLSELIIKRCLQETVPSDEAGLKKYNSVIEEVDSLEECLKSSGIFARDTSSILEYANNIDVLFINKKCQGYLLKAQNLMKKDLHDVVEVGETRDHLSLEIQTAFPRSSISRSVLDILDLAEGVLKEALKASEVCAGRLFCTVENILEKYATFVPEYHKKLLQTIPQQVAVFYNNCAYISHVLIGWKEKYSAKLPSILNVGPNAFTVLGRQLEVVASRMFSGFVDGQMRQIEEIMKNSGFQQGQTLDRVPPTAEKCLRQCLRQQELLKTVWQKILPYTIYNQTLGAILDSLCVNFANSVVKFEDISSEAAEQLAELAKMVVTRGAKLFTDPKEVALFVKSWYKVNELVFVLGASLLDIDDRWADGKGPLAHQFEPVELKQLIRALFQNTERRAALLNKIHH